jgi:hypothetical protein
VFESGMIGEGIIWSGLGWGVGRDNGIVFCSMGQLVCILGLSQTAEGKRALDAKSLNSSWISLWHEIISPPFLQSRACLTLNLCPHLSQCDWRSPGDLE